jgi:hypothetical protein
VARSVKKRLPRDISKTFGADSGVLWAWVKVKNRAAPSKVTMVWRREGKVRSTVTLDVGVSSGWRTWSRKSIGPSDTGPWTVDVLTPDGKSIHRMKFQVEADAANVDSGGVRAHEGEVGKI